MDVNSDGAVDVYDLQLLYETVSGIVKQIDLIARRIRLLDGTDIPMDDVLTLDGALFDVLD